MRNRFLTVISSLLMLYGLAFVLSLIYIPFDNVMDAKRASYYFLAITIISILLFSIKKDSSKAIKIIDTIVTTIFAFYGFILYLISLYTLPEVDDKEVIDTLAGAIFLFSSTIMSSYIFIIWRES